MTGFDMYSDYGLTCIFAGSEKEDDNTMMVIMSGKLYIFFDVIINILIII